MGLLDRVRIMTR